MGCRARCAWHVRRTCFYQVGGAEVTETLGYAWHRVFFSLIAVAWRTAVLALPRTRLLVEVTRLVSFRFISFKWSTAVLAMPRTLSSAELNSVQCTVRQY